MMCILGNNNSKKINGVHSYLNNIGSCYLIYSIAQKQSLTNCETWLPEVTNHNQIRMGYIQIQWVWRKQGY